jgi:hypothetical protein
MRRLPSRRQWALKINCMVSVVCTILTGTKNLISLTSDRGEHVDGAHNDPTLKKSGFWYLSK